MSQKVSMSQLAIEGLMILRVKLTEDLEFFLSHNSPK